MFIPVRPFRRALCPDSIKTLFTKLAKALAHNNVKAPREAFDGCATCLARRNPRFGEYFGSSLYTGEVTRKSSRARQPDCRLGARNRRFAQSSAKRLAPFSWTNEAIGRANGLAK